MSLSMLEHLEVADSMTDSLIKSLTILAQLVTAVSVSRAPPLSPVASFTLQSEEASFGLLGSTRLLFNWFGSRALAIRVAGPAALTDGSESAAVSLEAWDISTSLEVVTVLVVFATAVDS